MGVEIKKPTADAIALAARALATGGLVAIPTETVYGLAAAAENEQAVRRMYAAKGRPADHPVIVHIASRDQLPHWAKNVPDYAEKLMQSFWPGPMTLVLARTARAQDFITGGQDTVAVRVPNHPVTLELLQEYEKQGGKGLVAPSANRFGGVSPTSASDVLSELAAELQESDLILDGGECRVGIESTIIDCTGPKPLILRPGFITAEMIEKSCGVSTEVPTVKSIRVSGSHTRHYSPKAQVFVDAKPQPGDGLIALANVASPTDVVRLASPANLEEFATELYAALRRADALGLERVHVVLPEGEGLAIALRDRILRSAARGD